MSEQYALTGTVKAIMEKQTFASGFEKQEFVVTTDDQYPQYVKFEVVKDRIRNLEPITEGQRVTVKFNVRGNEYNGKYYVNLQAWYIAANTSDAPQAESTPPAKESDPEEDIPF